MAPEPTARAASGRGPVLVTGAGGFVGRPLVEALAADRPVVAVVRPGRPARPDRVGVRWLERDLATLAAGDLPAGIDTVVHLAQSRRFREFPEGADDVFAVNVAAVATLLDWAVRTSVRHVVVASSGAVYGPADRPCREDDPEARPAPTGFYAASKRAAEALAEGYRDHLEVSVLRFFFVYGAGQDRSMFMPRMVDTVGTGQPVRLDGPDGLRCNPVHVDDAVRAVVAAADLDTGRTLNVAGPEVTSLRDLATRIGDLVGRPPVFTAGAAGPTTLVGDTTRMTEVLGRARIGLAEGLADLCRPPA